MSQPPYASEMNLVLCHTCGYPCSVDDARCPRCNSNVHRRKPNSLNRTWAFLLASLICYIPANLLPVMYTNIFSSGSENTIFSGIMEFWSDGSWDLALLIFIASVAVPCVKFLVLGTLLITCQRRSHWARRERAKLYRLIEIVGYWSMLDVLVVALIAALVQFRSLSTIDPRMGILFFGLVVVLTMLAAISFDPRLIWDTEVEDV
ncbi:paraquat-inducible protein A [Pseudomonas sp. 10B1]|uniref:paraquat-inducible protein A n=1 Tax=unclassified Pseudomonas TaxID=196821 RepID=UPI002AB4469B|nr:MULTISPECIES: paraquat-inducible protein A [unclassified Pseudomonas]MDY7560615.1 paraquat-inducible protein A [Pseudomonas sp. AB6]MEA9976841.1 paraquat-inducible protein A [Pseudomonas sp. RTS4]MEA9993371.1 paraquat-inducible protein A [Pseudomonas sp. AA4]MEB0088379.1 paraquat-inducible protein A [Pseudomonas sp. RTI1]MEB0124142.1 paraquat-inducible protein A [Pseudomonas sp. CCC1.2]